VRSQTFADALSHRVKTAAGTPLVVHYDHSAGSRVELSGITFANWVAKTSSLAVDVLGLERGDRVLLDLPAHWIEVVWVGAALNVGLVLTDDPSSAGLVVVGPDGLEGSYGSAQVVATSLHPFALRFDSALPAEVVDFGAEVFGQPDAFAPYDPPDHDDAALESTGAAGARTRTMTELLDEAAAVEPGNRTITDVPCRRHPSLLLGPLQGGGVTVWSTGGDAAQWADAMRAERITAEVRQGV
jgi:uncharacterized protein (TIGR03089 family)